MGCHSSSPAATPKKGSAGGSAGGAGAAAGGASRSGNFGRDPALEARKHEFIVSGKENETIIRMPGKIGGQQFVIDNCTNCKIYLFDNIDTISIDDCKDCKIFVGPCSSSMFIRDCKNCDVIAAVQQFRARDCKHLNLQLFAGTAPIMESCSHFRVGCFSLSYFQLAEQFQAAGLSVWDNKWSAMYDFTGQGHWTPLDVEQETPDMLQIPAEVAASVSLMPAAVVPVTFGTARPAPSREALFVWIASAQVDKVFTLLRDAKTVRLIRTREFALTSAQASALGMTKAQTAVAVKGKGICLQFGGNGCTNVVQGVLSALAIPADSQFVAEGDAAGAAIQKCFVDWEDNTGNRLA